MAVMQESDRVAVWVEWMIRNLANIGVVKSAVKAAVDAADQWASDNATSYNNALPVTFRNAATNAQKALLLMVVIARRHLLGL